MVWIFIINWNGNQTNPGRPPGFLVAGPPNRSTSISGSSCRVVGGAECASINLGEEIRWSLGRQISVKFIEAPFRPFFDIIKGVGGGELDPLPCLSFAPKIFITCVPEINSTVISPIDLRGSKRSGGGVMGVEVGRGGWWPLNWIFS